MYPSHLGIFSWIKIVIVLLLLLTSVFLILYQSAFALTGFCIFVTGVFLFATIFFHNVWLQLIYYSLFGFMLVVSIHNLQGALNLIN